MPFPLIPAALSVVGSLAPSIISSIAGAKSEDEARLKLGSQMEAMRAQLIGRGVPAAQVEEQVNEAFKGIIQDEMQKGALPGWAEALLGVVGGGAGFLAGKALTKGTKVATAAVKQADDGAAAIAKTAKPSIPANATKGELPDVADPPQGIITPFGPRPAPRGTRMDSDPLPQSLGGKTGMDEVDAIADEAGTLVENRKYAPIPRDLLLPFGRMAGRPDELAADLARQRRFAGHSPIQGVDIEL